LAKNLAELPSSLYRVLVARSLPRPRHILVPALLGLACAIGLHPEASFEANASPPKAVAPAEPELPATLDGKIELLLAEAELPETVQIGISVIDIETGTTLYAKNPDLALNPASNAKLLTTAAALELLGPEHRYATRIWADHDSVVDGVVNGNIYLQGSGDPSLVTGEMYELAGMLESAGITKIKGKIVVDASRYDKDGWPPGFEQKDEFASHRAPCGATAVNYDTYELFARPGKALGDSPLLSMNPPVAHYSLASEATTVEGERNQLWVAIDEDKKTGKVTVTFKGKIGIDAPRGDWRFPVADPSRYAGELLAMVLREHDIKVGKGVETGGEVPKDADLLATHRSEPITDLIRAVNKHSNNFMAEAILRSFACCDATTADAALEALRKWSRDIGMPQDGLHIGNGSGLYDNNRISAAQLTWLLAHVHDDFRIKADFMASLAIMGVDGTTKSRLSDSDAAGWIRVKTGTLDSVTALSGYASAPTGEPLAFAIMFNGLEAKHKLPARKVQDAIAGIVRAEAVARAGSR
jgi:D-alanyl-D-alanine carboxypeptidase/D-alanyl-D-alanine-endopeptidase (penicillin-binding protein 4)